MQCEAESIWATVQPIILLSRVFPRGPATKPRMWNLWSIIHTDHWPGRRGTPPPLSWLPEHGLVISYDVYYSYCSIYKCVLISIDTLSKSACWCAEIRSAPERHTVKTVRFNIFLIFWLPRFSNVTMPKTSFEMIHVDNASTRPDRIFLVAMETVVLQLTGSSGWLMSRRAAGARVWFCHTVY